MIYYTPPSRFDEELDKPEFRELQRIRRRQTARVAVILIVLAVVGVVIWHLIRYHRLPWL